MSFTEAHFLRAASELLSDMGKGIDLSILVLIY